MAQPVGPFGKQTFIDYGLINAQNQSAAIIRGINAGSFGATAFDSSVFREASGNPTITRDDLTKAQTINDTITVAFNQSGQQGANQAFKTLFPSTIPTPVIVTPPQTGSTPSTNTIPAPVVVTPPVQNDRGTITNPIVSSPSIFTQAKPILLVGVALFAAVTLFVTPKASKRK